MDRYGFQDFIHEARASGRALSLGILGGSFDPIHNGHLFAGEAVRQELGLDKVMFLPCGNQPFKQGRLSAPAEDRLYMTELACENNQQFFVSDLEIRRPGLTYTVDTLREVRQALKGLQVELHFIIGADSWLRFSRWKEPETIVDLAHLVVVGRPGTSERKARGLWETVPNRHRVSLVDISAPDLSSTQIRDRAAQAKTIRYLVPDQVETYMRERGLYGFADGRRQTL